VFVSGVSVYWLLSDTKLQQIAVGSTGVHVSALRCSKRWDASEKVQSVQPSLSDSRPRILGLFPQRRNRSFCFPHGSYLVFGLSSGYNCEATGSKGS
jgi:hypothetical protein